MAARLDQFLVNPTDKFGMRMKDQMEQRLKHLTGGGEMEKNVDVMTEVLDELKGEGMYFENEKQLRKMKRKNKKVKVS